MEVYIKPIISATFIFPILAWVFTLPYMVHQYRKYGSILMLRVVIVYSFIYYMIASYFMTILPLPDPATVTPDSASLLLVPFDSVRRWYEAFQGNMDLGMSVIRSVFNSDFFQIFFNIVLLLPFGVYLRYYFKRKWYEVLGLSFLYSLFFEVTQITGLYGIYQYPYRFFEVDDLICNTLGGMLGFALTPIIVFMLPSREKLDEIAYKKGQKVSLIRRMIALMFDYYIMGMLIVVVELNLNVTHYLEAIFPGGSSFYVYPAYMMIMGVLMFSVENIMLRGRTIGKMILKLKITSAGEDKKPKWYKLILRNIIVHGLIGPMLLIAVELVYILFSAGDNQSVLISAIAGLVAINALLLSFFIDFCKRCTGDNKQLFYDRWLKLELVGTQKRRE